MQAFIRKRKKNAFDRMQTFMLHHELVVDGEVMPLSCSNLARTIGCSPQMIRSILNGTRASLKYTLKLIELGFPRSVGQLHMKRKAEENAKDNKPGQVC